MRTRAILFLAASTVAVAGCGNGEPAVPMSDAATATTAPTVAAGPDLSDKEFTDMTGKAEVEVVARDNVFIVEDIEVSAGTKVTFTNDGEQGHDVLPAVEGAFEPIEPGEFEPESEDQPAGTGTITFTVPGDYAYYCSLHGTTTKGMIGSIRVLE